MPSIHLLCIVPYGDVSSSFLFSWTGVRWGLRRKTISMCFLFGNLASPARVSESRFWTTEQIPAVRRWRTTMWVRFRRFGVASFLVGHCSCSVWHYAIVIQSIKSGFCHWPWVVLLMSSFWCFCIGFRNLLDGQSEILHAQVVWNYGLVKKHRNSNFCEFSFFVIYAVKSTRIGF